MNQSNKHEQLAAMLEIALKAIHAELELDRCGGTVPILKQALSAAMLEIALKAIHAELDRCGGTVPILKQALSEIDQIARETDFKNPISLKAVKLTKID
jgi:hypothetical protein